MKLQKHVRRDGCTFLISIPKDYVKALGWVEDQKLSFCPSQEKGTLTIIPLRVKPHDNGNT